MENIKTEDRSPVLIAAGLIFIIVITLGVLGLVAIQQRPTDVATTGNEAKTEAVADAASTPASESSIMTDTTIAVVTDTNSAVVTDTAIAVVTATIPTVVTDTAPAVVTTTVSVADTTAATTATVPLTAAAPVDTAAVAAAPIDMAAVTAAVTKGTCGACHTIAGIDTAVGMIGPDLSTIGTDAATRILGYTEEAYLRESIMQPNAFIAPKCPMGDCLPNLMLPNLADLLTPQEITTIVNYLLTLN